MGFPTWAKWKLEENWPSSLSEAIMKIEGFSDVARKPKKREALTILRLRVQTQGKFCEEGGSFQSEPTQGKCWGETQGNMFQL
jgi:hypothetical protein